MNVILYLSYTREYRTPQFLVTFQITLDSQSKAIHMPLVIEEIVSLIGSNSILSHIQGLLLVSYLNCKKS